MPSLNQLSQARPGLPCLHLLQRSALPCFRGLASLVSWLEAPGRRSAPVGEGHGPLLSLPAVPGARQSVWPWFQERMPRDRGEMRPSVGRAQPRTDSRPPAPRALQGPSAAGAAAQGQGRGLPTPAPQPAPPVLRQSRGSFQPSAQPDKAGGTWGW